MDHSSYENTPYSQSTLSPDTRESNYYPPPIYSPYQPPTSYQPPPIANPDYSYQPKPQSTHRSSFEYSSKAKYDSDSEHLESGTSYTSDPFRGRKYEKKYNRELKTDGSDISKENDAYNYESPSFNQNSSYRSTIVSDSQADTVSQESYSTTEIQVNPQPGPQHHEANTNTEETRVSNNEKEPPYKELDMGLWGKRTRLDFIATLPNKNYGMKEYYVRFYGSYIYFFFKNMTLLRFITLLQIAAIVQAIITTIIGLTLGLLIPNALAHATFYVPTALCHVVLLILIIIIETLLVYVFLNMRYLEQSKKIKWELSSHPSAVKKFYETRTSIFILIGMFSMAPLALFIWITVSFFLYGPLL